MNNSTDMTSAGLDCQVLAVDAVTQLLSASAIAAAAGAT